MAIALFRYDTDPEPFAFGGMGEVYKATDKLSGKPVVIKTIQTRRLGLDEKTVESFFKEAQAGFRLGYKSHHIARVLDIGLETVPYMSLELFEHSLVDDLGVHPLDKCRELFRQILAGVSHAHESGVVHSDLSPCNILLKGDPCQVAVSDFGLLKILETRLITRGKSLHAGGKPYYMPPHHFFDPDLIDESTDLYALGIIYFQILTGNVIKASVNGPVVIPDNSHFKDGTPVPDEDLSIIRRCVHMEYKSISNLLYDFAPIGMRTIGTVTKWVPEKEVVRVRFSEHVYYRDRLVLRLKDGGLHCHLLGRHATDKRPIEVFGGQDQQGDLGLGGTEALSEPEEPVYLLEGGRDFNLQPL